MQGIVAAEQLHFINALAPVDITGGATSHAFSMKNAGHASIAVTIGVSAAAFTKILLEQCTDAAGSNPVAMPYFVYKQETAGAVNDVVGARTAVAAGGLTPSANDGIFYLIEVDAAELDAGTGNYLQVHLTNGSNSVIASVSVLLSGLRYSGSAQATQTT